MARTKGSSGVKTKAAIHAAGRSLIYKHGYEGMNLRQLANEVGPDSYMIIVPAYTVSELTTAFEIGFLIYLPFIVIDLIVSNILLAMGMMMVSPLTISLPFKLFLFVMMDGWSRLIHGLVLTYQ